MRRTVTIIVTFTALIIGASSGVSAQSNSMAIEFANVGDAGPTDRVVVFVGDVACASISFETATPPAVVIGPPGQSAACGASGAEVTFLQFRPGDQQLELFTRTTFTPASSYELTNWAPQPPGLPLPAHMQAFIDAGAVIQPAASGNAGLAGDAALPPGAPLVLATLLLLAAGRRLTAGSPD